MEVLIEERRPEVLSAGNCIAALVVHALLFGALYMVGAFDFSPKETVIPIDLTVVTEENLDGNEDEPPPDRPPDPPEPPKPPEPPPPPPPPPSEPPKPVDAVKKVEEKKPEKKPEEKPKTNEVAKVEKPKEPEKPKEKTREERMREMRERAVAVKNQQPRTNGRTERRPPNWKELLEAGYKPGATTTVAVDEKQRCVSLIKAAFYDKWDQVGRPAWNPSLREIRLSVTFGTNGKVIGYRIVSGSGDAAADATVTRAAALVRYVSGLSQPFLDSCKKDPVVVRFKVTER